MKEQRHMPQLFSLNRKYVQRVLSSHTVKVDKTDDGYRIDQLSLINVCTVQLKGQCILKSNIIIQIKH